MPTTAVALFFIFTLSFSAGSAAQVVNVASAEELQAALEEKVTHKRVTAHLNTSGLPSQDVWGSRLFMFSVEPETKSITGACSDETAPVSGLKGDWTPKMCLVHVPEHCGLLVYGHEGILWIHQLYVFLTGQRSVNSSRRTIETAGDTGSASLYLTDVSFETLFDYRNGADAAQILVLNVQNQQQLQVLASGITVVGNDKNIEVAPDGTGQAAASYTGWPLALFEAPANEQMPKNVTVSLLNSTFESLYAERWELVRFASDLRLENCSFIGRPRPDNELSFDGRFVTGNRTLYSADPLLDVGSYEDGAAVNRLELAQSGREQRLAQGALPFLTLEDPAFLALQTEVLRSPPTPPPPPPPPVDVEASTAAVVVDVSTAEELQAALEAESRHVRIVDHIDTTGTPPQYTWGSGEQVLFQVPAQTTSITGACMAPPEAHLDAPWTPGMCVLHMPQNDGFLILEHTDESLWLHSLYLLVTGDQPVGKTRDAIYVASSQKSTQVYLTQMVVDIRPSHQNGVDEVGALTIVHTGGSLQILAAGTTFVANDDSIGAAQQEEAFDGFVSFGGSQMPRNSTMSLLNSNVTSRFALRYQLVYFAGAFRVENCTFSARPSAEQSDLQFDGRFGTGQRPFYSDDPSLDLTSFPEGPAARERPLAEAGREQRLAESALPFLTLDDAALLALQAEVASAPPIPAPPPPRSPPVPPPVPPPRSLTPPRPVTAQLRSTSMVPVGEGSASTDDSGDGTPVGAIVGSVLAGVVVLVAAVAAAWYLRRRGALRWPRAPDSKADSESRAPAAGLPAATTGAVRIRSGSVEMRTIDDMAADNVVSMTTDSYDTVAQALATQLSHTTSSGNDPSAKPSGSGGHTRVKRSDWAATNPNTMTETLASITYAGPMTAGHAGVALGKEDQVHVLEEVLDRLHSGGLKLGNRWTVLSGNQRRVGGQGLVQFVRDEVREEYCAVKFFFEDATFEREAELYARPSVRDMMAAVVHMEPAGGPCPGLGSMPAWIVLERGSSLSDWAVARKPDLLTSAQVLSQILQRLERLHALGLVHRDIKPANILWREAAKAWTLIDFGCVVDTRECSEAPLSFSLPYAAPEVIHALERGDKTMPVRTSLDIWSIGVVVYELLMKARVFPLGCTAEDMKNQLAGREPLPWERVAAEERRGTLAALGMLLRPVLRCLSRDPEARPTAQQLLETLEHSFTRLSMTDVDAADL